MNRNLLIFAVILLILVAVAYFTLRFGGGGFGQKTAVIGEQTFKLEIADTDAERIQGLSGRESFGKDQAMLFTFTKPEKYSFWMKDMRFPIDIIFMNNAKVVTIFHSVQPQIAEAGGTRQNLMNYIPTGNSNQVLEINAGLAKQLGLKEGDTVKLNL